MKNIVKNNMAMVAAMVILAIASVMTSCSKDEEYARVLDGVQVVGTPDHWTWKNGQVWIFSRVNGGWDSTETQIRPTIVADGKKFALAAEGFEMRTNVPVSLSPNTTNVEVKYNHDVTSNLQVKLGLDVMGGDGRAYTIYPKDSVKLFAAYNGNVVEANPFREEGGAIYELQTMQGRVMASTNQEFLATEMPRATDTVHHTTTEVVHDTTHIVINDTVRIVNHDTTFVHDTVTAMGDTIILHDTTVVNDTIVIPGVPVHDTTTVHDTVVIPGNPLARTLLYSDSNDTHVNTNTVGTYNQGVVTWSCGNRRDYVDHYNAAPYTGNRSVNFNIVFPYTVTLAGTAYQSMVGQSVNIVNGVADFNGFSATLVAQPRQSIPTTLGCSMDLTTATMTATGLVVNGEIEGTAVNGTIPVVINADPIINPVDPIITVIGQVVWAGITTSHTSDNVNSGEDWLHILVNNNGTYTWYYHVYEAGLTLGDFEAAILLPYEYNNIVNQLNAGRGLAKVYHHADQGATYEMGTVYGQQYSSGGWKISYYNVAGNLMNVLSMSSSTFSGYQTSNPIKAVASNGSLSYGGMSYAIRNN